MKNDQKKNNSLQNKTQHKKQNDEKTTFIGSPFWN